LASTSAIAPRNKEKAYTKKKEIEIIVASLLLLLGLGEPRKKESKSFSPCTALCSSNITDSELK
jgi:hypothetical protein